VVSRDPGLDAATLEALAQARPELLIATCRDAHFPSARGLQVGPGPTVERVERALGRTSFVVGKPNPYVLGAVMGIPPAGLASTLVVGDSVEQDVALGRNAGAISVLLADPVPPHPAVIPDHAIRSLDELLTLPEVQA
jgi:ribonucleotide monophosphatase NagD (HAD superfamily)